MKRIFSNWKMGGSVEYLQEKISLLKEMKGQGILREKDQMVLLLPMPLIALGSAFIEREDLHDVVAIGAQKVDLLSRVTGGVNAAMLKNAGAHYVCVGHSERRMACAESDHDIAKMTQSVLIEGGCPIICVGESAEERAKGWSAQVIEKQLRFLHEKDFDIKKGCGIIIAYEPIWSIGANNAASQSIVAEMLETIENCVSGEAELRNNFSLVYGGSVSKDSVGRLMATEKLEGFLVGRSSLSASEVEFLLRQCAK